MSQTLTFFNNPLPTVEIFFSFFCSRKTFTPSSHLMTWPEKSSSLLFPPRKSLIFSPYLSFQTLYVVVTDSSLTVSSLLMCTDSLNCCWSLKNKNKTNRWAGRLTAWTLPSFCFSISVHRDTHAQRPRFASIRLSPVRTERWPRMPTMQHERKTPSRSLLQRRDKHCKELCEHFCKEKHQSFKIMEKNGRVWRIWKRLRQQKERLMEMVNKKRFDFILVYSRWTEIIFFVNVLMLIAEFCKIASVPQAHLGMTAVFPAKCDVMKSGCSCSLFSFPVNVWFVSLFCILNDSQLFNYIRCLYCYYKHF